MVMPCKLEPPMGSKPHVHVAPGHCSVEEVREAMGLARRTGLPPSWQALVPLSHELAAELEQDLIENALEWRIPAREEVEEALRGPVTSMFSLKDRYVDIVSVLDRGEIWLIHAGSASGPLTLVVGLSLD